MKIYEPPKALDERLKETVEERHRLKPELNAVLADFVEELKKRDLGRAAPSIGQDFPSFRLPDAQGREWRTNDFLLKGPAIFNFFRGRWCAYCWTTKQAMDEALDFARAVGVSIVGITPDDPARMAASDGAPGAPILHDAGNAYAQSLGVSFIVDEHVAEAYVRGGLMIDRDPSSGRWRLPMPASFLVGADGVIVDRFVDPDFRKRLPLERFLNRAATLA